MIFTLEKLIDSIIGMLKQNFPGIKAYSNLNQQETNPPCFLHAIQHGKRNGPTYPAGDRHRHRIFDKT